MTMKINGVEKYMLDIPMGQTVVRIFVAVPNGNLGDQIWYLKQIATEIWNKGKEYSKNSEDEGFRVFTNLNDDPMLVPFISMGQAGNSIDVLTPVSETTVRPPKMTTIEVNGDKYEFFNDEILYDEIAAFAGYLPNETPMVKWRARMGDVGGGMLHRGKTLIVQDGMRFTVVVTGNA